MSTDVLFSVVIPAYNAETFIGDCVTSVCEQLFDSGRYEVIVVDDGSSDGTARKVRTLQEKYDNLKLICQENGRQGKARNTGVRSSKGLYIMFLDSDDMWLSQNVLSCLYKIITEHNPDYIFTKGYTTIPLDYCAGEMKAFEVSESEIIDADTCIASQDFSFSCCNYVYKRGVFDALGVTFAENCFFEDLDFCVRALFAMGVNARVAKLYFPYYGYRENPVSTTRRTSVQLWQGNLAAIDRILDFICHNRVDNSYALHVSMQRCKNDLLRKPFVMFKERLKLGDCFALHRQWKGVLCRAKSLQPFCEWVSHLPLFCILLLMSIYRVLRYLRRFVLRMTK